MGNYHVVLGDYDRGSVDGGEQMIKVLNIHIVSIAIASGLLLLSTSVCPPTLSKGEHLSRKSCICWVLVFASS